MKPLGEMTATGVLDEGHENIESLGGPTDAENLTGPGRPGLTTRGGRRHVHLPVRWLVIGALAAVLAGGAGWVSWWGLERHQQGVAASQAVEAATNYALRICNMSPGTVDENFTTLFNNSTEQLNDSSADRAVALRKNLLDHKVVAHGTVATATVESATTERVSVLLLVNESLSSSTMPQQQHDQARLKITMQKVGERWLADDVKLQ